MAHQPKPATQTYTTDWAKIKGWANAQKINPTAVSNVQTMDLTRLQNGYYPMSNSERTRAILAAAGMNYNTALPTDNPKPSNLFGNVINNVRGIATGLMPNRLVSNIFGTLKNTLEDVTQPGHFAKEGGLQGALTNSALSWIPGAFDVGTYLDKGGGKKGLDALLEQPITTLLDVMPALKLADSAVGSVAAKGAIGDALAARLGVAKPAVEGMGALRMAGKGIGSIKVGGLTEDTLGKDKFGQRISTMRPTTIADRMAQSALNRGMGKAVAGASHALSQISNKHTIRFRQITKDLVDATANLTKDHVDKATGAIINKGSLTIFNEVMHSGRSFEQVMADAKIPLDVKKAVRAYQPWEHWHKEYMIASGKLTPMMLPDGSVALYETTSHLLGWKERADAAIKEADDAGAKVDEINAQALGLDQAYAPLIDHMEQLRQKLGGTLAMQPHLSKAYLRAFGRLTGKGGLLEEMKSAADRGDIKAVREAAKKAAKALDAQFVLGRPATTKLGEILGKKVVKVNKEASRFTAIPKDHIRLFKAEGHGDHSENWTPSYSRAKASAGDKGNVYRVDVPNGLVAGQMDQFDLESAIRSQRGKGESPNAPQHKTISLRNPKEAVKPGEPGIANVPMVAELKGLVTNIYEYAKVRSQLLDEHDKLYEGTSAASKKKSVVATATRAAKVQQQFMDAVRAAPQAEYRDVVLQNFFKAFRQSEKAQSYMNASVKYLKKQGYDDAVLKQLRQDPQRMYELIVAIADPTFRDPFIPNMTPEDHALFMHDALNEAESLRARGVVPMYVPTVGAKFVGDNPYVNDRVYVNPTRMPSLSAVNRKAMDMSSTVNDVMLGVTKATKEALNRDATIEFMHQVIKPMLRTGTSLRQAISKTDEFQRRALGERSTTVLGINDDMILREYGLVPFNVSHLIDLGTEEMGLHPKETYYVPAEMKKQLELLVGREQFPLHGTWDKATGVFKYSILGLSPRYTAHILLGGSMLMALRVSPHAFGMIGDAAKMVRAYHKGEMGNLPANFGEVMQGAVQRGSPDMQISFRGGRTMGKWVLQEKLEAMGVDHRVATAAQWASAAANANFQFTNYISDMQRAITYLDGAAKARRHGTYVDELTGHKVDMTDARAHWEGMQAAERVMGNLQAMTPLERNVARKIMPFYGWTKHILKYVLTYPVDHPWRAMFLSTLATQNTDRFSKGLDERMQLLLFLGTPDAKGNVSAIDIRQINPFRDVANYATLSGWISSLNPIITAPFAAIDPSIIYGDNTLHPNITYNAVYGTNEAGASGGWLSAAEQEIPELGAVDQALGLTARARALKKQGGTAATKAMLSSLGIPWEVQHLNLPQISAKHEIDRYNQAKSDAANFWSSGDFSTLAQYPADAQLPDPRQAGYNITPAQLKAEYDAAAKAYPGLPPSETVASLSAPSL